MGSQVLPLKIADWPEKIGTFFVKLYEAAFGGKNWQAYQKGIGNTLLMTILALMIGIFIGCLVAIVKYSYQVNKKNHEGPYRLTGIRRVFQMLLGVLNGICHIYTTVIRGTPVMVQLLIIYHMIFSDNRTMPRVAIAAIAFGINSGAYVAEIIRGGLQSIPKGQMETGRSLGLSSGKTMWLIVLPQAVRNILPSLFNELISLIKETSISGMISVMDITQAGDGIRAKTYSFYPLLVTALLYLIIVLVLTQVQKIIERRMALGD